MERTPRHLVLDFGGVITRSLFENRTVVEELYHLPKGTLGWYGPLDPPNDELWQRYLVGAISERQYWYRRCQELEQLVGQAITINRLVKDLRGYRSTIRPEAISLIDCCKNQGRKVGLLTNELELFHGPEVYDVFPVLSKMDSIVDATHTHVLKPDRRAYQLAVDELGERIDSVVFVDDQQRNILGAEALGIRSIHIDITRPAAGFTEVYEALQLDSGV